MKLRFAGLLACGLMAFGHQSKAWDNSSPSDSVIVLVLENEAGMVTQVQGLSQRECATVLVLLTPPPELGCPNCLNFTSSGIASSGMGWITSSNPPSSATKPSSNLKSAKCLKGPNK